MIYRLHQDRAIRAVRATLPGPAALELTRALDGVLADPKSTTTPYGVDDGVMRLLTLSEVMAVLMVNEATATITLLQITSLT